MTAYRFRPATEADVALLRRWRAQAHVERWWGAPDSGETEEALADERVANWIVEHAGHAIAYAQDYSPHHWTSHPFSYLPLGSRGIDQYIGEPELIGRGHGTAFVREHCDRLFAAGAPAIGTDPHPSNASAIRAYENASFKFATGPVDTP